MTVLDINALLNLPEKERRKIAQKLWYSLAPEQQDEETVLKLLDKRWNNIKVGNEKAVSSEQFWKKMEKHLATKKQ